MMAASFVKMLSDLAVDCTVLLNWVGGGMLYGQRNMLFATKVIYSSVSTFNCITHELLNDKIEPMKNIMLL